MHVCVPLSGCCPHVMIYLLIQYYFLSILLVSGTMPGTKEIMMSLIFSQKDLSSVWKQIYNNQMTI